MIPRNWAALVLLGLAAAAARAADDGGCGICHGEQRVLAAKSVHSEAELRCVDCHGGDPAAVESKSAAHDPAQGYRGRPSRTEVAEACGTCHADVVRMRPYGLRADALAAWRSSHHGQALAAGREDAATCTDCHGVHDVLRTADPASPAHARRVPETCGRCHADAELMARHDTTASAPADFAQSVHGQGLAAGRPGMPSCADCHDAHAASPPGATEVADVCGNCHRETLERFRESPHFAASERGAMAQCVTCHGNHAVDAPDYSRFDSRAELPEAHGSGCLACHDPDRADDRGAEVALAFGREFRATEARVEEVEAQLDRIALQGFSTDDERHALAQARREMELAVPLSHAADLPRVEAALRHVRSLADGAAEGCEAKVKVARDRRIFGTGAGVALLGIAGFLALRRRGAARP